MSRGMDQRTALTAQDRWQRGKPGGGAGPKGSAFRGWHALLHAAAALLLVSHMALAVNVKKKLAAKPMGQTLDEYIQEANHNLTVPAPTSGGLWNPQSGFANLMIDYKAYKLGDLVTINVVENTTAAASGSVKTARQYSATSGISQLFGVVGARSGIQNLISPSSQEALTGSGQTASTSALTTSLTGTVVAVLPNGFLVVQTGREVEVDNQRQKVTLRGIIRPGDLDQNNSVASTQVGNLTIEVEGRGVISDGVRRPHILTRAVMKVLGF
jgi:flagellar L-ring protein FlgH